MKSETRKPPVDVTANFPSKKALGNAGEETARLCLMSRGYLFIEKNFSCRLGEIDLIMKDGEEYVFVEVKTRTGRGYGTPGQAVDRKKMIHMRRVAEFYLASRGLSGCSARFDVVEIYVNQLTNCF